MDQEITILFIIYKVIHPRVYINIHSLMGKAEEDAPTLNIMWL